MNSLDHAVARLRQGMVISGVANCHVAGLYSLVLMPRATARYGMLRVFYAGKSTNLDALETGDDFAVMPHNHRQDITLHRLFGHVENVRVSLDGGSERLYECSFESALLTGDFWLRHRRMISTASFEREAVTAAGIMLKWSDLHTVITSRESAWVVDEGQLAPDPFTSLCYSRREDKALDSAGLYRAMSPAEIAEISHRIAASCVKL